MDHDRTTVLILLILLVLMAISLIIPPYVEDRDDRFPPGVVNLSGEYEFCTVQDKANLNCQGTYQPVCGSDGVEYNNACQACKNKAPYWVRGTCDNVIVE